MKKNKCKGGVASANEKSENPKPKTNNSLREGGWSRRGSSRRISKGPYET